MAMSFESYDLDKDSVYLNNKLRKIEELQKLEEISTPNYIDSSGLVYNGKQWLITNATATEQIEWYNPSNNHFSTSGYSNELLKLSEPYISFFKKLLSSGLLKV